MYKKKILDLLIAAYAGVSSTILSRIAEEKAKTVTKEEDCEAAAESVTLQSIIEAESDRRATQATQSAVANYEKKHSLKEGKPVNEGAGQQQNSQQASSAGGDGKEGQQGGDLAATIAAAIKSAVEPLTAEIATLKTQKAAEDFNTQLSTAISGASDKFKERIQRDSRFLKFDTPEAQAEWLEAIKAEAAEDAADNAAQGAVFGRPKTGGSAKKEEVAPVPEGQPY